MTNKCVNCACFPFCEKASEEIRNCKDFIKRSGENDKLKRKREETEKEIPREDLFLKKTFL